MVADAKLKTGPDDNSSTSPTDPEDAGYPKRSNSLSQLSNIPETRRVSYSKELERAARHIVSQRLPISRRSKLHRAEPINTDIRTFSSQGNLHKSVYGELGLEVTDYPPNQHSHIPRSTSSVSNSSKKQFQLVIKELPPPVPLRVRHEDIIATPEPIIAVRKPATTKSARMTNTSQVDSKLIPAKPAAWSPGPAIQQYASNASHRK